MPNVEDWLTGFAMVGVIIIAAFLLAIWGPE